MKATPRSGAKNKMIVSPGLLTVAIYAGLNGLIAVWLAANVGRVRTRERVSIGDGANPAVVRAMRGHANFVEFVPLCLIQLVIIAALGTPVFVLHLLGAALTIGRVLHGWHFVRSDAPGWQRSLGAFLTVLVLSLSSLGLIGHALVRLV